MLLISKIFNISRLVCLYNSCLFRFGVSIRVVSLLHAGSGRYVLYGCIQSRKSVPAKNVGAGPWRVPWCRHLPSSTRNPNFRLGMVAQVLLRPELVLTFTQALSGRIEACFRARLGKCSAD